MKALQQLGLSQRGACKAIHARHRSSRERPSTKAQEDAHWAKRLTEVAHTHSEHGCRRLYEDYGRDADPANDEYMNYKRFRRIYRVANLQIGRRRRRGRARIVRGRPLRRAAQPFEGWTLDFIHDRLLSGRAVRVLSMEDEFSRSGLALEASFTFPSRSVTAVLDNVAAIYGYPKYLRIDNELSCKVKPQAGMARPRKARGRPRCGILRNALPIRNCSNHGDTRSQNEPSLSFKRSLLPIGRSEHYLRGRDRLNGPSEGILPSGTTASKKWRYSFSDLISPYATRATLAATAV